jgi:hypothetical protein
MSFAAQSLDAAPPGASVRFRLAVHIAQAVLAVPGVVALDPGRSGLDVTAERAGRISGVRCTAGPSGGYDVTVRLVSALVALEPLGVAVRAAAASAAALVGVTLERVDVHVADVVATPVPVAVGP